MQADERNLQAPSTGSNTANLFPVDDTTTDFYDWPLLAAGCILSHTLLDALMVQAIYNPDIISFWESLTGTGKKGYCSSADSTFCSQSNDAKKVKLRASTVSTLSPMKLRRSVSDICFGEKGKEIKEIKLEEKKKDECNLTTSLSEQMDLHKGHSKKRSSETKTAQSFKVDEESKDFLSLPHRNSAPDNESKTVQGLQDGRSKPTGTYRNSNGTTREGDDQSKLDGEIPFSSGRQSSFDKVGIPQIFVGKTFDVLFHSFLECEGAIPIALYRAHHNGNTNIPTNSNQFRFNESNKEVTRAPSNALLPIVVTAPAMETMLLSTDEVFILWRTALASCL